MSSDFRLLLDELYAISDSSELSLVGEPRWHAAEIRLAQALAESPRGDARLLASLDHEPTPAARAELFAAAAEGLDAEQGRRMIALGARLTGFPALVSAYLAGLIGSGGEPDERVLAHAERLLEDADVVVNFSSICYAQRWWSRGIAFIEQVALGPGLPEPALLNAALLHAGAGDAARARSYARLAAASGDEGAAMIEAAARVLEGELEGAIEALREVRAAGYTEFGAWRDDAVFEALFEREDYRALFG